MRLERRSNTWSLGSDWYNLYHDKTHDQEEAQVNETDGSMEVFQSSAYNVLARAHLTQGCKVYFYFL